MMHTPIKNRVKSARRSNPEPMYANQDGTPERKPAERFVSLDRFDPVDELEQRILFSTTVTLAPTADSYVAAGAPTANYGTSTQLDVQAIPSSPTSTDYTYLKFNLSSIQGDITSVTLYLYNSALSNGITAIGAYPVSDTSWGQTTIAWSNQPGAASTTALATATISTSTSTSAGWTSWGGMTSYVGAQLEVGNSTVSFVLQNAGGASSSTAIFDSTNWTGSSGGGTPYLSVTTDLTTAAVGNNTYVSQANPTTNYGTSTTLDVSGASSAADWSYLKFSGLSSSNTGQIVLAVKGAGDSSSASVPCEAEVIPIGSTWSPSTLTWNTPAPSPDTVEYSYPQQTVIGTTSAWYEWDVTSLVEGEIAKGNTSVTLAILPGSGTTTGTAVFSSSRGASAPELIFYPQGQLSTLVAASSSGQVSLSAQALFGAATYQAETSTSFPPTPLTLSNIGTASSTPSYVDGSVTNGHTYYYSMQAVNAAGVNIPAFPPAGSGTTLNLGPPIGAVVGLPAAVVGTTAQITYGRIFGGFGVMFSKHTSATVTGTLAIPEFNPIAVAVTGQPTPAVTGASGVCDLAVVDAGSGDDGDQGETGGSFDYSVADHSNSLTPFIDVGAGFLIGTVSPFNFNLGSHADTENDTPFTATTATMGSFIMNTSATVANYYANSNIGLAVGFFAITYTYTI